MNDYKDRLHINDLGWTIGYLHKMIDEGYLDFKVEEVLDIEDFMFRYDHFGQLNSIVIGEHVYGGDQEYYTIIRGGVELNYLLNLPLNHKSRYGIKKVLGKMITFYKEELYWDLLKNIRV